MKKSEFEARMRMIEDSFQSQKSILENARDELGDAGYHEGLVKAQDRYHADTIALNQLRDVPFIELTQYLFEQGRIYTAMLEKLARENPAQLNEKPDPYSYALGMQANNNLAIGAAVKKEAEERDVPVRDFIKRLGMEPDAISL